MCLSGWGVSSHLQLQKKPQLQLSKGDLVTLLLCRGNLVFGLFLPFFPVLIWCVLAFFTGSLWIVLVADADGFVPLTFKQKEEITVRNGKRKLSRSPAGGDSGQSDSPP